MTRQPDDPEYLNNLLKAMADDSKFRAEVHEQIRNGNLEWLLTTPQLTIKHNILNNAESLALASRRLGKSFAALVVAIELLVQQPGSTARVYSSTQKNCEDIVNDNMTVLEQLCPPGFIRRVSSKMRWYIGDGGSDLRIHSMDSIQTIDDSRGGKADIVILEEIGFVTPALIIYTIDSVIRPMFLRSKQRRIAFITTAATDPKHWLHSELQPRCEEAGSLFTATIYDNPHVSEETIAEFKSVTLPDAWAREYLCEPHVDANLIVVPEFRPDRHINDRANPPHLKPLTVIDFGGVRDKTGVILGYWDVKAEQYYVRQALLFDKFTPTDHIVNEVKLAERATFGTILKHRCADGPGQLMVDLRQMGFSCWTPKKPQGSWEAGILDVRNAFLHNTLAMHSDCELLVDTLQGAQYNKNRTDFERTEEYGHADLLAALMYFIRHASTSNCYPDTYNLNPETQYIRKRKRPNKDLRAALMR